MRPETEEERLARLELEGLVARLGREVLKPMLPKGLGFSLFLFDMGGAGFMAYVSSAKREDFAELLREYVNHLGGEDGTHKVEADVLSGRSCAFEQSQGDGPCGACVQCLRKRIAELEVSNAMACIEPRADCQCSGCRFAADVQLEGSPTGSGA